MDLLVAVGAVVAQAEAAGEQRRARDVLVLLLGAHERHERARLAARRRLGAHPHGAVVVEVVALGVRGQRVAVEVRRARDVVVAHGGLPRHAGAGVRGGEHAEQLRCCSGTGRWCSPGCRCRTGRPPPRRRRARTARGAKTWALRRALGEVERRFAVAPDARLVALVVGVGRHGEAGAQHHRHQQQRRHQGPALFRRQACARRRVTPPGGHQLLTDCWPVVEDSSAGSRTTSRACGFAFAGPRVGDGDAGSDQRTRRARRGRAGHRRRGQVVPAVGQRLTLGVGRVRGR